MFKAGRDEYGAVPDQELKEKRERLVGQGVCDFQDLNESLERNEVQQYEWKQNMMDQEEQERERRELMQEMDRMEHKVKLQRIERPFASDINASSLRKMLQMSD